MQHSYKFYAAPQKWVDARDTCRSENATLAMPKNENEASVLKNIFSRFVLKGVRNPGIALLGFHDMFKEGEYLTDEGKLCYRYSNLNK